MPRTARPYAAALAARRHARAAAHSRPRRVLAAAVALAATLGAGLCAAAAPAAATPTAGACLYVGALWLGLCAAGFGGLACYVGKGPRGY